MAQWIVQTLATIVRAALLGLRHAALVAGGEERAARTAARLGATWGGAGHALAVLALGLPVVVAHALVPGLVERLAETAIGVIIVVLAGRLLLRRRRGAFHVHAHEHGGRRHTHLHAHGETAGHAHEHLPPRTPVQAFLIGVTHGVGGSAPVALLASPPCPEDRRPRRRSSSSPPGRRFDGRPLRRLRLDPRRSALRDRFQLAALPLGFSAWPSGRSTPLPRGVPALTLA